MKQVLDELPARGVPASGNLMPFNVTQQQAINIALENALSKFEEVEAEIYYNMRLDDGSKLVKYV